jgi:pyrroline-5-carboxylate reductase
LAECLLAAVGGVVWVPDDAALDAVTALSGSGPAYVLLFLEALIAGGIHLGLEPESARRLALGTLTGTTQLVAASKETPALLRERITSQGGTTAAALQTFTDANFNDLVSRAMRAAAQRAHALAEEFGR